MESNTVLICQKPVLADIFREIRCQCEHFSIHPSAERVCTIALFLLSYRWVIPFPDPDHTGKITFSYGGETGTYNEVRIRRFMKVFAAWVSILEAVPLPLVDILELSYGQLTKRFL